MGALTWIQIPKAWMPTNNEMRLVKMQGKNIVLIQYQGKFYATSAKCPHAGANLAGGFCENGRIICPYHRHAFNLETGRGDEGQNDYITVYPLKQAVDDWFIALERPWYKKWF